LFCHNIYTMTYFPSLGKNDCHAASIQSHHLHPQHPPPTIPSPQNFVQVVIYTIMGINVLPPEAPPNIFNLI
jgi:hypothetical protein